MKKSILFVLALCLVLSGITAPVCAKKITISVPSTPVSKYLPSYHHLSDSIKNSTLPPQELSDSFQNSQFKIQESVPVQRAQLAEASPQPLGGLVSPVQHPTSNIQNSPDGSYIYIPDSIRSDVMRLLEGHSKVVDDQDRLDTEEKVIYRGDTLPMVLKSINLGRYDRGLSNFLYIPKGILAIGLTASYGEFSTDDLEMLGLISDVSLGGHIFSIKPYLQYFIRNNLAIGLKFGYYNAKGSIGSFDLNIDDDMNFSLHDIMYRSSSFSGALTLTQYLGLTRRGRFGVFNEVELAFQNGSSTFQRPFGGELRTTDTETFEAQLNFSPGLQVFIMKQVAFHVSFGVFGFSFKNEKQKENGVKTGSRFSSGANFRFNIFNINFGIAINV